MVTENPGRSPDLKRGPEALTLCQFDHLLCGLELASSPSEVYVMTLKGLVLIWDIYYIAHYIANAPEGVGPIIFQ